MLVNKKESIIRGAHLLLINSDSVHFQRGSRGNPGSAYHPIEQIITKVDMHYIA